MSGQVAEWVSVTLEDESTRAARDEAAQRAEAQNNSTVGGVTHVKPRSSFRPSSKRVDRAYLVALNEALKSADGMSTREELQQQLEAADAAPIMSGKLNMEVCHARAVASLSRGSLLLKLERTDEAIAEFERAIEFEASKSLSTTTTITTNEATTVVVPLYRESSVAVIAAAWHKKGVAFAQMEEGDSATEAHMTAMRLGSPALQKQGVTDFLNLMLDYAEDWNKFDVDGLEAASLGKPISAFGAHAFGLGARATEGLLARISLGETVPPDQRACFYRYCLVLDLEYSSKSRGASTRPGAPHPLDSHRHFSEDPGPPGTILKGKNSYHNRLHGADVMQATFLLSAQDQVFANLDDCATVALLIAAMVHDFRHPGLNNVYMVKVSHELAIRYSDDSVLERMHLAEAFELLALPKHDWLRVEAHGRRRIRALIIHSTLATDLAHSGKHIATFAGHVHANSDFAVDVAAQRSLVAIVLKAADVSHPTRRQKTHSNWSRRIILEFFEQGDIERALDVPISPLCDRTNFDLASAQTGFIDFVTRPIFAALDEFCAGQHVSDDQHQAAPSTARGSMEDNYSISGDNLHVCLRNLEENYRFWKAGSSAVWKEWKETFAELGPDADLHRRRRSSSSETAAVPPGVRAHKEDDAHLPPPTTGRVDDDRPPTKITTTGDHPKNLLLR